MTTKKEKISSIFTLKTNFESEEAEKLEKYIQLRNRNVSSTIPPTNAYLSLVEIKEERERGGSGTHDPKIRPFIAWLTVKIERCLELDDLSNITDSLSYWVEGSEFPFPYEYAGLKITRDEKNGLVGLISFSRRTSDG